MNYYQTLSLSPSASEIDIKKAFKTKILTFHPDKNQEGDSQSKDVAIKIIEAYKVLSNKELRKKYDTQLQQQLKIENIDIYRHLGQGSLNEKETMITCEQCFGETPISEEIQSKMHACDNQFIIKCYYCGASNLISKQ